MMDQLNNLLKAEKNTFKVPVLLEKIFQNILEKKFFINDKDIHTIVSICNQYIFCDFETKKLINKWQIEEVDELQPYSFRQVGKHLLETLEVLREVNEQNSQLKYEKI